MKFIATEFDAETCKPTGRSEIYFGNNVNHAARSCLHAKRLANGQAKLGPTDRVVYVGQLGYALVET